MKKLLLFLIPSLLFSATLVKTYETGITFEFAEKNMLEDIKNEIIQNRPEVEKKLKDLRLGSKKKIQNYKPKELANLQPALKNHTFYPDMTYTNPNDIYDNEGKVIYPKGFKFNPLDFQMLSYQMIVVNGTSQKELEWLINNNYTDNIKYKILLSDGNYEDVSKKLNQKVFYAIPKITDKFNLEHTPSVITQIGNKMEVKEICISCKKDEK